MAYIHPLQTKTWADFRERTGVKVVRGSNFFMTLHPIPKTKWNIGYLPKGELPTKELIDELKTIGESENCIFIQLEPNIREAEISNFKFQISNLGLKPSAHPLFTKYTFVIDLKKSEEDLLKNMHPKTRYNIKVAQKNGVTVQEDNSNTAFHTFLKLNHETNTRQKFYSHPDNYFQTMREVLQANDQRPMTNDLLSMHLLTATYNKKILTAWILFINGDILYYPYGASSTENRDVMANNLMMWEAILFGKKHKLKLFDMWGSLGPNPNPKDSWFGFHRFKQGYGAELVEFIGSYDLVINKSLYEVYKIADKLRWLYLRLRK